MSPLKARWFSGRATIGLVQTVNDQGEIQYRIGAADGFNEAIDVNLIVAFGAHFPKDAGDLIFGERPAGVVERPAKPKRVSTVVKRTGAKQPKSK